MKRTTEDTSQLSKLFHCPQCDHDCGNARQLFKHVETIPLSRSPTCLEKMGMQSEEFRAGFLSRRRKVAQRKKATQVT